MTDGERWPVRIAAIGPVAVGTALWRAQEQWSVTVMVKGTFELVANAPMRLVEPEPLSPIDRHEHDSPNRSLCVARETAPQLRQAEVVVFGQAHAAPSADGVARATRSAVRLAVGQGPSRAIDKTLVVLGDRPRGASEPTPFERIPLGWERCLGGVGCPDNPLGVGLGASAEVLPNFVDPRDPERRSSSLGPLPQIFPARRKLLGAAQRGLREQGAVMDIGPGVDWDYFQCAMPDQRVRSLQGDEWIELDGLTEELRLRTRLPGGRALAHNYGQPQPLIPDWIPLRPDLVQIYAHRRRCTVVWRGGFPIASAEAAQHLVLGAGLELGAERLRWPRSAAELPAQVLASQPAALRGPDDGARADAGGPTVVHLARSPESEAMAGGTIGADASNGAGRAALPWEKDQRVPASPMPVGPTASEDGPSWALTANLSPEERARACGFVSSPFELAPPKARGEDRAEPAAVPGAPWSDEKLEPLPTSRGETTVILSAPPILPQAARPSSEQAEAARLRAEADTLREAEAQRLAAEQAEAARIKAEADALRAAEAQRFAAEQAEARAEAERRAAQDAERRSRAAGELRTGMYGAFKRKG